MFQGESAQEDTDLVRILNTMATGYMHLENYECRKAMTAFKSLDVDLIETGWVQNQMARACYEMNDYPEVCYRPGAV